MKILIDGDGCPVVPQTVAVAQRFSLECLIFVDTAHEVYHPPAQTIVVDTGSDMVDFALVNRAEPGDIVVTQDYGLAAMALAKGASAIHQDGDSYTQENIDGLLAFRHIHQQERQRSGRFGHQKKRTPAQDKAFLRGLTQKIKEHLAQT